VVTVEVVALFSFAGTTVAAGVFCVAVLLVLCCTSFEDFGRLFPDSLLQLPPPCLYLLLFLLMLPLVHKMILE